MHKIYSMRSDRTPTAASIENPFPPISLAKSRRFISDNIGHAIRKTKGGVLDPELSKKLAKLIAMEKNTLRSMENASRERMDAARTLSAWAEEQEDDVSDVIDKVSVLINEVGDLEDQYVDRYDQYRNGLKQIRDIERVVQPIRNTKQKTIEQIGKLRAEETPGTLELESLEQKLVRVEAELIVAEKQLSTITHEKIKHGFEYQFDAMQEFGEKLAIIAGYGKHLLQLLQDVSVFQEDGGPEYTSYDASASIVGECDRALTTWVGSRAAVSTDLPARVRSMMSVESEKGKTVELEQKSKPRAMRRWSSDGEDGGDALSTIEESTAA